MIHKFSMENKNIVIDVYSGAVHEFDSVSFDVLDHVDKPREEILECFSNRYTKKDVLEAIEEIEQLRTQGLLFTDDPYEKMNLELSGDPVIKAACFHVSHDCNLRCSYCFASTGNFGGQRLNMGFDVGKDAVDFLIQNSGNRKNIEVDFFGGEPMLNFDVVKQIVEYTRGIEKEFNKNFRFTITTNALHLDDEKIDYINANMANVVLSIDGRKEINDAMRKRIDGKGSYDKVLENIKRLVEKRGYKDYYVRGTFTKKNLDFFNDVMHLVDQGFDQVSVEPVVAGKGTGYEITLDDIDILKLEYEKLAKEYVIRAKSGKGFVFFHFLLDLAGGPCVSKRLRGCGSGSEYISVTPKGDIYPCHQFVGDKNFKLGNVKDGILNKALQEKFKKSNVYTRQACRSCWAKFYCSGGCPANAYQFEGDINSVYDVGCELEKKRLECALWIKAQENLS